MVRIHRLGRELHRALPEPEDFPEVDGSSASIRALKRDMDAAARDPHITVLIVGESGTGKERIAQALHRASPRAAAPFVVVDCGGISPTLAEDALFGHVRGAFTGAVDDRAGPFELADGGTLLLDEIGDLPLDLQMKLLRAIQSRTVQRLGGSQRRAFDIRIIAATHVDLAVAVARGRFREDLYYRLKVYEIAVPPLRRRGSIDIRELSAAILGRLAACRGRAAPAIDDHLLDLLARHTWPGNVRELENVLERALVTAAGSAVLTTRHLPRQFQSGPAAAPLETAPPAAERIVAALQRNDFRAGRSAADLGISRHQLYRLVKRYGIARPPKPG